MQTLRSFHRRFLSPLLFLTLVLMTHPLRGQDPRTVRELRLDTAAALEKVKSDDPAAWTPGILDLCRLHEELVIHPQFRSSGVLTGCRARIASRLNDLVRALRKLSRPDLPDSRETTSATGTRYYRDMVDRQLRLAGSLSGGPLGQGWIMAGHFAPGDDHSDELIQLIQQTIDPDQWRNNGGEASISYWQPAGALVVTASQLTQERIETLLIGLRGR